jgi:ubiquinone biosynthesis protein COQ9
MTDSDAKARVLDAALAHVPFDGWSDRTLQAAMTDAGLDPALGRVLFARGGVDLALAYHAQGDAAMVARLAETDLSALRFRDRIATAIRCRLDQADRELVRRGTTLFALPQHAADGATALWQTADKVWTALGDTSQDFNWYTKRATLSAVHAATVLFWLGDESPGHQATWDFLDRRIEDVMQFEKFKGQVQENPFAKALMAGPIKLAETLLPAKKA